VLAMTFRQVAMGHVDQVLLAGGGVWTAVRAGVGWL